MLECLGLARLSECQPELIAVWRQRARRRSVPVPIPISVRWSDDPNRITIRVSIGHKKPQLIFVAPQTFLGQDPTTRPMAAASALEIHRARLSAQLIVVFPEQPALEGLPHEGEIGSLACGSNAVNGFCCPSASREALDVFA